MDGEDIRYLSEVESRHARLDAYKASHESRLPVVRFHTGGCDLNTCDGSCIYEDLVHPFTD